ncbi:LysR family transcriptional regulator [Primorskyibacter flagellatus]|uniref:LysR family transcriptional regulator n=1 Tax=Primorskyibacter flagellatus TaxID=1387277 RepID=UPI003A94721D
MTMDLRKLRIFVTIAETGSFTQAASHLRVAQPVLSYHMTALEQHLGVTLLTRNARGTAVTGSGRVFLTHATNILKSLEEAEAATRKGDNSVSGDVVVGLLNSIAISLTVPLLRACQDKHPSVRVRLVEGNSQTLRAGIETGEYDLAINLATVVREKIRPIAEEDFYLVGRPPHVTCSDDVPFRDLLAIPLILPSTQHGLRMLVEWSALQIDAQIRPLLEVDGISSVKALVRDDFGATIFSRSSLQNDDLARDLNARRIIDPPIRRRLVLHQQTGRPTTRAVSEVGRIVLQTIHDLASDGLWRHLD